MTSVLFQQVLTPPSELYAFRDKIPAGGLSPGGLSDAPLYVVCYHSMCYWQDSLLNLNLDGLIITYLSLDILRFILVKAFMSFWSLKFGKFPVTFFFFS